MAHMMSIFKHKASQNYEYDNSIQHQQPVPSSAPLQRNRFFHDGARSDHTVSHALVQAGHAVGHALNQAGHAIGHQIAHIGQIHVVRFFEGTACLVGAGICTAGAAALISVGIAAGCLLLIPIAEGLCVAGGNCAAVAILATAKGLQCYVRTVLPCGLYEVIASKCGDEEESSFDVNQNYMRSR